MEVGRSIRQVIEYAVRKVANIVTWIPFVPNIGKLAQRLLVSTVEKAILEHSDEAVGSLVLDIERENQQLRADLEVATARIGWSESDELNQAYAVIHLLVNETKNKRLVVTEAALRRVDEEYDLFISPAPDGQVITSVKKS